MQFEFAKPTKSKLSSVNVRSEKHGKELVPAVDMKITVDSSNSILDKFHPDLKSSFYFKAEVADDEQDELDGIDPVTDMPNLRFAKLEGPFKYETTGAGYGLEIDFGLGGDSNLRFHNVEVNNFAFACKEGGTVEVSFRAQVVNPDESLIGKLATLVQHEIDIVLTAPEVTQEDVEPLSNPFPLDGGSDAPLDPFTPEMALAASHAQ